MSKYVVPGVIVICGISLTISILLAIVLERKYTLVCIVIPAVVTVIFALTATMITVSTRLAATLPPPPQPSVEIQLQPVTIASHYVTIDSSNAMVGKRDDGGFVIISNP